MNAGTRHSFPLLIAAIAGVAVGNIFDSMLVVYGGLILALSTLLFISRLRYLLGPILCFTIAVLSADLANPSIKQQIHDVPTQNQTLSNYNKLIDENVELRGFVLESVTTTHGERTLVSASSIIAGQRYECENIEALVFTPPGRRLYPGDEIAVSGLLRSFNDSVSSAYKLRFQAAKGPVLSIHSYSIPIIVGHSSGIMTWAYEVNERLSVYIDNTPLSPFSKGFIKSVILGNRGGMTHYDKSVFADAGVSHVLAVSGMHVGIICMILLSLTIPLQLFKSGFFIRYCICGIAIWLYVLLTGLSYSSIRATLMLSVVVIAILCGRKRSPISALFISTVLILLCDPHSLYSIGLWLSFSCVASIIIGTPVFNTIDISVHPRTHRVVSFLLTTLVATASTWMLSAYFFGVFPTHFLLANVVILPVLPLYVILSGTYLIFLPLLRLNSDLYYAATNLVDYPPRFLAEMLNVMSLDAVNVNIPLLSLVFYYAGLLLIFCTMFNKTDNTSEREYIRGDNASLPYELVSKPHTAATPRYIAGAILVIISILMI